MEEDMTVVNITRLDYHVRARASYKLHVSRKQKLRDSQVHNLDNLTHQANPVVTASLIVFFLFLNKLCFSLQS